MLRSLLFHTFLTVFFWATLIVPQLSFASAEAMTIALPADVILRSLKDILPLDINEPNDKLDGRIILNSITRLVMEENSAVLQGMVIGKDVTVNTRVGDQKLRVRVGDLFLPLTCDLLFRFDAARKVLYVKPRLRVPAKGAVGDMANSVATLLALVNSREYPIALTSLDTFHARVGSQDISVDMEPVDIRVAKGKLVVSMKPRLSKTN